MIFKRFGTFKNHDPLAPLNVKFSYIEIVLKSWIHQHDFLYKLLPLTDPNRMITS
jgi:hypothetical protein